MKKTLILVLTISLLALSFSYGCGPKKPETGKIKGIVTDSNGNPVAEATVVLEGGEGIGNTDTTLDDGTFLIEAAPGTYTLKVEKEGFEIIERTVEIKAGETVETSLTIKKKEEKPVFKSPTDLKSYHIIIYAGPKKEEAGKVFELWKDDNGDKIRVVALQDKQNSVEVIKVGDDYAMKVGDAWSKNQPGLKEFFNNLLTNFEQEFEASKGALRDLENYTSETAPFLPFEYKIEKLGNKMVNGYKSTGYRIAIVPKEGNELKEPAVDMEIWAISTGKYKDYITKQDIVFTSQDGSTYYYGYNFLDIGEEQNIIMP
ncbi:MAG: hypothetical protein DRI28_02185 [Caldiserica bacterium]|nr:MAG: hypothetical protein DRI28_02185 [Caldisericota bacterium]